MKGDEIVRPFDRHSNETATVMEHVTKYKHMRKLMLVFLGKFENRGIKIALLIHEAILIKFRNQTINWQDIGSTKILKLYVENYSVELGPHSLLSVLWLYFREVVLHSGCLNCGIFSFLVNFITLCRYWFFRLISTLKFIFVRLT